MKYFITLLLFSLFTFFSASIDINTANYFYDLGIARGTIFYDNAITHFFYVYGNLPGTLFAAFCLIILFSSLFTTKLKHYIRPCFFFLAIFIIGNGLLINVTLKEHWGRPRPKETIEFGGQYSYRPFYAPDFSYQGNGRKSFPSGHVSMGTYFYALYFFGKRLKKIRIKRLGFLLFIILGSALSFTRIAQGGHYFSDVVFSWIIMIIITQLCYLWILQPKQS